MIGLNLMGVSVSDSKIIVEALQSFVETVAIIVAGVWTYDRFVKTREDHPYPRIQHRIQHCVLEDNRVYLSVFVTVTNEGKEKLNLGKGKIFIRQVSPLTDDIKESVDKALKNLRETDIRLGNIEELFVDEGQRLRWVTLGYREWSWLRGKMKELEPGQTREIQFDFLLLENDVKVIEAISYFDNTESNWVLATLYSLDTQSTQVASYLKY